MTHLFVLLALVLLQGILLKGFPGAFMSTEVQLTANFGFLLLSAYLFGEWASRLRLPKLSGYLLAGILLGPEFLGYFSKDSANSLRFIDDLALTYIALAAGLELRLSDLRRAWKTLLGLSLAVPLIVFPMCFSLLYFFGSDSGIFTGLSPAKQMLLAALAATLAVARSPSSTVAIIKECKARGTFSETVLCVTVVTDIIVIVLFSFFLSLTNAAMGNSVEGGFPLWLSISLEISLSFLAGLILAWGMAMYERYIKADRIFFFLCVGFLVTRFSNAFSSFVEFHTGLSLHLEPLLIAMCAGFCLQNLFRQGSAYEEAIDRSFLPIFVVFFALAGMGLDFHAFVHMWPWALAFAGIRFLGIFIACHSVTALLGQPRRKANHYSMSFITQAGVSIGLVALVLKRFPIETQAFYTLLLAVILMNQIVGPIAFKVALERSGEAKGKSVTGSNREGSHAV